jgi:Zn-dependent alcohol dehydrogenase
VTARGRVVRAAVLEASGAPLVVRDDVRIAEPGPGQVRVHVAYCGVCHSDLSIVDGTFPSPLPVILGHEASGVVEAVGPDVHGLALGDPVVLSPLPPCGRCYWCVRGEPGVCANATGITTNALPDGTTGLSRHDAVVYRGVGVGAFGDHVLTPATGAVKIPADVPLEVACVIGCAVQTGVGAVLNTARVEEGATVLVMGLGGVGLSVVQGARIAGAVRIIAVDPLPARRAAAVAFGATDVIDPTAEDVTGRTRALTEVGADYAFEVVGRGSLVTTALWATRNGGTVVCVGAAPLGDSITIDPAALFTISEKKLLGCALGSCNSLREIPRLIGLWRTGRLDLEGLITNRRPLAEVNEALADLRAGRGIRTVLAH